jgi:hypothetical protein
MQQVFSKKVHLKKPDQKLDFTPLWDLTKIWSGIFKDSKGLASTIRNDLKNAEGKTPADPWDKEMALLFPQQPTSTKESKVKNYYIKNRVPYQYRLRTKIWYGHFSAFAYYQLSKMFNKETGPEINSYSLGLSLSGF